MKIRIGTFNLFQFVEPPYSWYTKKEKFNNIEWEEKTTWIKQQITDMNCDVIGFQEVFSKEALENLVKELGFKYFVTVDFARTKDDKSTVYVSTTVGLASKYPIKNIHEVKVHVPSLKKHGFNGKFKFSRIPIKADITFPNDETTTFYICHLKSNRENEFEYVFTKDTTLEQKKEKVDIALKGNYSDSLRQRLCEASSLFFDLKRQQKIHPCVLMCDLNDREFSITIDALTNNKYHDENRKESFVLTDAYHQHKKKVYNPHPEYKGIKRPPTSYFIGKGNVLDYIFISNDYNKKNPNAVAKVSNYEVFDKHINENHDGSILKSDHAQVVCELDFLY